MYVIIWPRPVFATTLSLIYLNLERVLAAPEHNSVDACSVVEKPLTTFH